MTRFVFAFLVAGALLLGAPNHTNRASPPIPKRSGVPKGSIAKAIFAKLALDMSVEAAQFVAKVIQSAIKNDLCQGKYTPKPVAVIQVPDKLGPCLTLPKSFKVVMTATSDGKPVSNDPQSRTVPYVPNAKVFMTSFVKVEVAAFYPIKEIRYTDGKLVLPKDPVIVAGYRGREGERSTWEYHGGARWNDDKMKAVANDLTLKALDVAREHYKRSQSTTEEELGKKFEEAVNRMIVEVTK